MKPVFKHSAGRMALVMAFLLAVPSIVKAQDVQPSPTPLDERAQQRAEKEAKKAAEQEEKALRTAAEKERKAAEAAAKRRAKDAPRLEESGPRVDAPVAADAPKPAPTALPVETPNPDVARMQRAEEKARAEAEKARQREDDRIRAQEAKDAERRRKDEERALREAAKAREIEDKARAAALKKEQEEAEKNARRNRSNPDSTAAPTSAPAPREETPQVAAPEPVILKGSKDEDRRRKELVKQIEKARAERDRLNREAEAAEGLARAARIAANDGQRSYEALTTGLDVEDITLPPAPAEETPRKNRFVTKADEKAASAAKNAPQNAPDPLRIALDLKRPEPEEREKAAFALASLGPDALPATRALMAALADTNASVRIAAAQALGRIGPGATAAIPPLAAALTDPDPAVKNAAQAALIAIQGRY